MSDYIIEDKEGFFYWDDRDELVGPFRTKVQCEVALDATLRWEAKDHQPQIRKMKDDMGM